MISACTFCLLDSKRLGPNSFCEPVGFIPARLPTCVGLNAVDVSRETVAKEVAIIRLGLGLGTEADADADAGESRSDPVLGR